MHLFADRVAVTADAVRERTEVRERLDGGRLLVSSTGLPGGVTRIPDLLTFSRFGLTSCRSASPGTR